MARDSLGDRMKEQYEDRTRYLLPRRSYTVIRLDGKAFHTFTRKMDKPFDAKLIDAMNHAASSLAKHAQGAMFAYVQSDEISLLLTDFAEPNTEAWFNGNVQKICSVSASIVTGAFGEHIGKTAFFDARVFTIPDEVEVENYFIWRQKDWNRNSIQMLGRSHFSHKQLHEKSIPEMHEMLHGIGVNWANLPQHLKNGTLIHRVENGWEANGAFTFTGETRPLLTNLIPKHWETKEQAKDEDERT